MRKTRVKQYQQMQQFETRYSADHPNDPRNSFHSHSACSSFFVESFLSSLVIPFVESFISFSTSLRPSLKLLTPLPKPFINSGIFFPPNRSKKINAITINSGASKNNRWFIWIFFM